MRNRKIRVRGWASLYISFTRRHVEGAQDCWRLNKRQVILLVGN